MNTKEEILKRLSEVNDNIFLLDMLDHWTSKEGKRFDVLWEEKQRLEKELEKIENERK